jgi:hypothetical protein
MLRLTAPRLSPGRAASIQISLTETTNEQALVRATLAVVKKTVESTFAKATPRDDCGYSFALLIDLAQNAAAKRKAGDVPAGRSGRKCYNSIPCVAPAQ